MKSKLTEEERKMVNEITKKVIKECKGYYNRVYNESLSGVKFYEISDNIINDSFINYLTEQLGFNFKVTIKDSAGFKYDGRVIFNWRSYYSLFIKKI